MNTAPVFLRAEVVSVSLIPGSQVCPSVLSWGWVDEAEQQR